MTSDRTLHVPATGRPVSQGGAHAALLLAAALWGFGNIAQKTVLEHIGPLSATCFRCAIAAAVLLPFALMEARSPRRVGWWASISFVAVAFAAAISIQQAAYVSATVVNASFLVNTGTVLTPLFAWIAFRERTNKLGLLAAAIALLGIFLMANGIAGFTALNNGDLACLLSAIFYAVWMIALGRHAQQFHLPLFSAFIQFVAAAFIVLPFMLILEPQSLSANAAAAPELAVLGIFSTAAAFGLQTFAQRYTSASKAAVLVSGESIFGAIGAYTVLQERPPAVAVTGATLIFIAILLVSATPGGNAAADANRPSA